MGDDATMRIGDGSVGPPGREDDGVKSHDVLVEDEPLSVETHRMNDDDDDDDDDEYYDDDDGERRYEDGMTSDDGAAYAAAYAAYAAQVQARARQQVRMNDASKRMNE